MNISRRDVLRTAIVGSLSPLATLAQPTFATTADYKALVCVFFFGGLDCHDVVIPFGQSAHSDYARARSELLDGYQGSRDRINLLPLNAPSGSSQYAFPPEFAGLQALFNEPNSPLAIVGNVGPLIEPVTVSQVLDRSARLPPRLFSHNDQQSVWQASQPEGAQYGWGGLFADAVIGRNDSKTFTTITGGGADLFLTGRLTNPYQVSLDGRTALELKEIINEETSGSIQSFNDLLTRQANNSGHLLIRDLANAFQSGFRANATFASAIGSATQGTVTFPTTGFGRQLDMVTRAMSVHQQLGVSRQVFLVGMGGFDTHSGQAGWLPKLLADINDGLVAFNKRIIEMGYSDKVTLFTASDFGRTLAGNGDGTDHGWGGHHLVMGGAVNGGSVYGDIPASVLGNDRDAGQGRLIPTIAVEEYSSALGQWFGLSNDELLTALPNLKNFDRTALTSLLQASQG